MARFNQVNVFNTTNTISAMPKSASYAGEVRREEETSDSEDEEDDE